MEAGFKAHLSHVLTAQDLPQQCLSLLVNLESYRSGSISAQLSLEPIAEAPMSHQDWHNLPAVSGQMEVPLSTASPVLYCVFLRSVHLLLSQFLALVNGVTDVYLFLMNFGGFEMTSTL